jgi:hypothetical protein
MERVVRIFKQFEDADRADYAYFANLSPDDRVAMLLDIIENHRRRLGESAERFERACRIVALGEG